MTGPGRSLGWRKTVKLPAMVKHFNAWLDGNGEGVCSQHTTTKVAGKPPQHKHGLSGYYPADKRKRELCTVAY